MNEDNKDINEEFENSDNSLNNQSDDEITSQPSEAKSADDQIALKVFKYFKEFIFCVAFLILAWILKSAIMKHRRFT